VCAARVIHSLAPSVAHTLAKEHDPMGVFTLTETRPPDSVARDVVPGFPASTRNQANVVVHRVRGMMKNLLLLLAAIAGVASIGCQSSGIGDPCIHEREHDQNFSGFSASEVDVESRSFQCKSRVCLVAYFQGRSSCPYGQTEGTSGSDRCFLPGTKDSEEYNSAGECTNCVVPTVDPQLIDRPPTSAMYCSCRCAGPDSNVRYCECPSGYSCEPLITFQAPSGNAGGQLVGSYCIKDGTKVDNPGAVADGKECNPAQPLPPPDGCGTDKHPAGL
jgi:hypothetical protein